MMAQFSTQKFCPFNAEIASASNGRTSLSSGTQLAMTAGKQSRTCASGKYCDDLRFQINLFSALMHWFLLTLPEGEDSQ